MPRGTCASGHCTASGRGVAPGPSRRPRRGDYGRLHQGPRRGATAGRGRRTFRPLCARLNLAQQPPTESEAGRPSGQIQTAPRRHCGAPVTSRPCRHGLRAIQTTCRAVTPRPRRHSLFVVRRRHQQMAPPLVSHVRSVSRAPPSAIARRPCRTCATCRRPSVSRSAVCNLASSFRRWPSHKAECPQGPRGRRAFVDHGPTWPRGRAVRPSRRRPTA